LTCSVCAATFTFSAHWIRNADLLFKGTILSSTQIVRQIHLLKPSTGPLLALESAMRPRKLQPLLLV
jgi:hypothetical protein